MNTSKFENLSKLLYNDEKAHDYYVSLPYNIQRELINRKDEIHSISDMQNCVKLAKNYTGGSYS